MFPPDGAGPGLPGSAAEILKQKTGEIDIQPCRISFLEIEIVAE
jgi:hypothetical protein